MAEWEDEQHLAYISGLCRDGCTQEDIAKRIGITVATLRKWRKESDLIYNAFHVGREMADYIVENALFKSAIGYRTTEETITTTIRNGKIVETVKEKTTKNVEPSIKAIQMWLYNRTKTADNGRPKWMPMNSSKNILEELGGEDRQITIEITKASDKDNELNKAVKVRKATKSEAEQAKRDYWPDNWEDDGK